jgi:uncharacterized protein YjbI with pentapeptide repeats
MDNAFKSKNQFFEETFSHIYLSDETIKDKEFEKCSFEKCSFIQVNFENCKFIDCVFFECVLSAVKPFNSSFSEVKFKDSKVIGVDWTKAKNIRFLDVETSQIDYSNFSFVKLPQLKLKNCVAHEVDFTEADLNEGDFEGTDFERTIFSKTNLTKCNFRKATNYLIDFRNNKVKKAKFSLPEAASLLRILDIDLDY